MVDTLFSLTRVLQPRGIGEPASIFLLIQYSTFPALVWQAAWARMALGFRLGALVCLLAWFSARLLAWSRLSSWWTRLRLFLFWVSAVWSCLGFLSGPEGSLLCCLVELFWTLVGSRKVQFSQVRGLEPSQFLHRVTSHSLARNIV